jgi:putative ABC transport system permease protein
MKGSRSMVSSALRDLRWRFSSVAPVVVAAALVLTAYVVVAGWAAAIRFEAGQIAELQGAQSWIAPQTAVGPFSAGAAMTQQQLSQIRALPDVLRADPVLVARTTLTARGSVRDVVALGVAGDGLGGLEKVKNGSSSVAVGQVVVSSSIGVQVGDVINIAGDDLEVAGVSTAVTAYGGVPLVAMHIDDTRKLLFADAAVTSMVVIRGEAPNLPRGLRVFNGDAVRRDLARPSDMQLSNYRLVRILAALLGGALLVLAGWRLARERHGDLAVARRYGVSTGRLLGGLAVQCLALAFGAMVAASVLGVAVGGVGSVPFRWSFPSMVTNVVLAVPMAAVAVLGGVRRARSARLPIPFALS